MKLKLLAVPTIFFRALSLIAMLASGMVLAQSDEVSAAKVARESMAKMDAVMANPDLFPGMREIFENSRRISDEAESQDWSFLNDQSPDWLKKQVDDAKRKEDEPVTYLFASRSMLEMELVEMMREASGAPNVTVVFKGVYPEERINDAMKEIHRIIERARLDEVPNVVMNPLLFKQFNVSEAPHIILARHKDKLIEASGTFSVDWLKNEYQNGRSGNMGNYGTVSIVNELDLIDVMKEKLKTIDFAYERQRIVNTYWERFKFEEILESKTRARFQLEPSVVVAEDVKAPDGKVLARRGDTHNMLEQIPFPYKLIFFDGTSEAQIRFVQAKIAEYEAVNAPIQLIASKIHKERGWRHLKELDERFGHPVYILNKNLQQRFNVSRVPSVVEADNRYFYIENYPVAEYRFANGPVMGVAQ